MKKTLSAALAAIITLTLVGCSGEKDSGRTSSEATSATTAAPAPVIAESLAETDEQAATVEQPSSEEERPETAQTAPTEEPADTTDYVALIQQYDNLWLGLPSASKVYVFSDKQTSAEIDGITCRAVSCFDEHEGVLYYMCDFYISKDGSVVYRDETSKSGVEGEPPVFVLLPEETETPLLDPTTQLPEDIFATAKELSALFTPFGSHVIACDNGEDADNYLEVDGERFDRVTDERFSTKESFFNTLDRYFSFELVSAWMELGNIAEQDGNIYVRHNDGVGANPFFDRSEYELTFLSEESAVFTEYRYYLYEGNEEECVERTYTAQFANGIWRFTDFTLEIGD